MNKQMIWAGVLISATGVSGVAMAVCGSPSVRLDRGGIRSLLGNSTVCVSTTPGSTSGPWIHQEFHGGTASGAVTDWKLGAGHPVDPTTEIGTWITSGSGTNSVVNYSYVGGDAFSYAVFRNGVVPSATYSFCNGSTEVVRGVVYATQVSCDAGGTRK